MNTILQEMKTLHTFPPHKGMRTTSLRYNKAENDATNTVPIFRNKKYYFDGDFFIIS